jgi:hypothetical protein
MSAPQLTSPISITTLKMTSNTISPLRRFFGGCGGWPYGVCIYGPGGLGIYGPGGPGIYPGAPARCAIGGRSCRDRGETAWTGCRIVQTCNLTYFRAVTSATLARGHPVPFCGACHAAATLPPARSESLSQCRMPKPLRCRLRLHAWEDRENPETGEDYLVCVRCNAHRDREPHLLVVVEPGVSGVDRTLGQSAFPGVTEPVVKAPCWFGRAQPHVASI